MNHQREAVNKLQDIKVGALYMEMGTGKTRTALELTVERLRKEKVDCILWLCPVNVKRTIADEVEKHLDGATYQLVDSTGIKKDADIYIAGIESTSQSDRTMFHLYNLVNNKDCFVVVDESSLIKNYEAKRTQHIWRLGEQCGYKLILNGTPVTNTEEDLYCQWYFLDWRILGYSSYYSFAANHLEFHDEYNHVVKAHDTELLVEKISPYTYQVAKSECLDLPQKNYSTRWTRLSLKQQKVYQEAANDLLMDVTLDQFESYTLFRLFTALQKVVSGIHYNSNKPIFSKPEENIRVKTLLNILKDIPNEKTIIWCKYQYEINVLKKVLKEKYGKEKVAEFWGELSEKKRNDEIDKFRNNARFLVANKSCGAFGLNLQFCSYAIYYSNDFNWATRKQSEDRLHRAGQTENVHIIDIICENTIDERIRDTLLSKDSLIKKFKKQIDKFKDKPDIERWLKKCQRSI